MKKLLFVLAFVLTLSIGVLAKTHTADLLPPEQIEFTLAEHEDTVKYTLYVEEDGLFGLKVISVSSTSPYSPKLSVTLLDKGKELSGFSVKTQEFSNNEYYMLEGLAEGEYTVKIENDTKFGDVSFIIDTFFTPWDSIEAQGGNSHENATVMEHGKKYKGGVMHIDTKDFYTFTMPEDGYAVIDLYSSELKYFTLYDEMLNEIGVMDVKISEPDKMFETRCGLKKGKYYISVSPDEDYLNPEYALFVKPYFDADFETEYNNTKEFATPLTSKELRGNLYGVDDVDMYSFTLDKKSIVTATITDLYLTTEGHYDFSLLASDGTPVITHTKSNTHSFKDIELDKGTYYLSVSCPHWRNFTAFGYKVRVEARTSSQSQEEQTPSKPEAVQFDDISTGDWFAEDILTAREKGLIEGSGDNKFNPSGNVTVAEAITMASRMYEKHFDAKITPFKNDSGKWYSHYVLYAIAAGIISPDDFDDYDRSATRAEMAYIYSGVLKNAQLPGTTADELYIPDVDINHKYFNQIQLLYKLNILNGVDENGTFLPENNVTRAESAVIMLRVAKLLKV